MYFNLFFLKKNPKTAVLSSRVGEPVFAECPYMSNLGEKHNNLV